MNSMMKIFKKELVDIFRDKKTIIFSILLPIIIYPAMFGVLNFAMKDIEKNVEQGINIGIKGGQNTSIVSMLKEQKNITIVNDGNLDEQLKKGKISLILDVPADFDAMLSAEKPSNVKFIVDQDSNKSMIASGTVKNILENYNKAIVATRLEKKGIDKTILTPFQIQEVSAQNFDKNEANALGSQIIGMLPSLIIIFMLTPTLAIAADFVAGEKERGTMEPLLSTAVNRMDIMWGKLLGLATVAVINLLVSLGAMGVSLQYTFKVGKSLTLTPKALLLIGLVSIFVLIAICAIEISISLFAKSVKEANAFLSGVTLPVFLLSYVPMMMDAKNLKMIYFNIPIVNAVALMKEFVVGIYNYQHIGIVMAWHMVYVICAVIIAKFMFSREEVVFRS